MKQTHRIKIMSRRFVILRSVAILVIGSMIMSTAVYAQRNWMFQNLTTSKKDYTSFRSYLKKGYKLCGLYKGFIDKDRIVDYVALLTPEAMLNANDSIQAKRPLVILISNHGKEKLFTSYGVVTPYFHGSWDNDAFAGVVIKDHTVFINNLTKSERYVGAALFVQMFRYNQKKGKLINVNCAIREMSETHFSSLGNCKSLGKYFEDVITD